MALPYTSHSVLAALRNLSQQTNRTEREAVLKAGLKEILKWFTLAAKNIIENKNKFHSLHLHYYHCWEKPLLVKLEELLSLCESVCESFCESF